MTQSTTDTLIRRLLIEDSVFSNNTANVSAGVLSTYNVNLVVNRSVFINNVAIT